MIDIENKWKKQYSIAIDQKYKLHQFVSNYPNSYLPSIHTPFVVLVWFTHSYFPMQKEKYIIYQSTWALSQGYVTNHKDT